LEDILYNTKIEEVIPSRISLLNVALMRLDRAISYQFFQIEILHSEAQFESIKFNKDLQGNWEKIDSCYFMKWKNDSFEEGTKCCLDYLCVILWRLLNKNIDVDSNKNIPFSTFKKTEPSNNPISNVIQRSSFFDLNNSILNCFSPAN